MAKCKSCGADIVWLLTKKGKKMPVLTSRLTTEDRELIGIGHAVEYRHGDHLSHFADCKDADMFRMPR